MHSKEEEICRFCLKILNSDFKVLRKDVEETFAAFGCKINLSLTKEPVVCNTCSDSINRCFEFKEMITSSIIRYAAYSSRVVDLREVYIHKSNIRPLRSTICIFCIQCVEENDCTSLSALGKQNELAALASRFVTETNLEELNDPVICSACKKTIKHICLFIEKKICVEEEIKNHRKRQGTNSKGQITLSSLLQFKSNLKTLHCYNQDICSSVIKKELEEENEDQGITEEVESVTEEQENEEEGQQLHANLENPNPTYSGDKYHISTENQVLEEDQDISYALTTTASQPLKIKLKLQKTKKRQATSGSQHSLTKKVKAMQQGEQSPPKPMDDEQNKDKKCGEQHSENRVSSLSVNTNNSNSAKQLLEKHIKRNNSLSYSTDGVSTTTTLPPLAIFQMDDQKLQDQAYLFETVPNLGAKGNDHKPTQKAQSLCTLLNEGAMMAILTDPPIIIKKVLNHMICLLTTVHNLRVLTSIILQPNNLLWFLIAQWKLNHKFIITPSVHFFFSTLFYKIEILIKNNLLSMRTIPSESSFIALVNNLYEIICRDVHISEVDKIQNMEEFEASLEQFSWKYMSSKQHSVTISEQFYLTVLIGPQKKWACIYKRLTSLFRVTLAVASWDGYCLERMVFPKDKMIDVHNVKTVTGMYPIIANLLLAKHKQALRSSLVELGICEHDVHQTQCKECYE